MIIQTLKGRLDLLVVRYVQNDFPHIWMIEVCYGL